MQPITFSHSKINTILSDPFLYFLTYKLHLKPAAPQNALQIGSAVHYGLEHNTVDLDPFFKEHGSFEQKHSYSEQQAIAESMVSVFQEQKGNIFSQVCQGAKVLNIYKEYKIEVKMKNSEHSFLGIIDLLIETDKGWIVVDYKTSSKAPVFEQYLEQLYRYCFLLSRSSDKPIFRLAIISLRKPALKRRATETPEAYKMRLITDYKVRASEYLTYDVINLDTPEFTKDILERFYDNLEQLIIHCGTLANQPFFPINYSAAYNMYGKSTFYDLIYFNEDAALNSFYVNDFWYDKDSGEIVSQRPLTNLDLKLIVNPSMALLDKTILHFDTFSQLYYKHGGDLNYIYANYQCEPALIENYLTIIEKSNVA